MKEKKINYGGGFSLARDPCCVQMKNLEMLIKTHLDRIYKMLTTIEEKIEFLMPRQKVIDDKPMWDNATLCKILGVSKRSLQRYRSKGILPYHRNEGRIYYDVDEVKDVIDKILERRH